MRGISSQDGPGDAGVTSNPPNLCLKAMMRKHDIFLYVHLGSVGALVFVLPPGPTVAGELVSGRLPASMAEDTLQHSPGSSRFCLEETHVTSTWIPLAEASHVAGEYSHTMCPQGARNPTDLIEQPYRRHNG